MSASCGLCERDLEDGYLCPGDTLALARRLDRMPKLWRALEAFLRPGGRASAQYGRTQAVDAPLPVSEPVLDLRTVGLVKTLEDWRSFAQADRGWSEPVIAGSIERRIIVAARALSINLDWMAANWPPAGDMAREVRDLERSVLSIVDPDDPAERGRRIGHCVAKHPDDTSCGATLRLRTGDKAVRCAWCGTVWPPCTWAQLKEWQDEDGKAAAEGGGERDAA